MPPSIQPAHAHPPRRLRVLRQLVTEVLQSVLQVVFLVIIFSALIGRYEIQQTSMEPTFHEGQRILVSKFDDFFPVQVARTVHASTNRATIFDFTRGQVIVFHLDPQHRDDALIKRIIAGPGDRITFREGSVYVNDERLTEDYVHGAETSCASYCGPLTLNDNQYFVLGDNRTVSRDSRAFGPINDTQIVGRVVLRYWPPTSLSLSP